MNTTISITVNIPFPENWYTMAEAAKLINANMGRTKLFHFLRDEGILMDDNEPYQRYIDNGCFKYVVKDVYGRRGQVLFPQTVSLVSPKGIDFIKKLLKNKGLLHGSN